MFWFAGPARQFFQSRKGNLYFLCSSTIVRSLKFSILFSYFRIEENCRVKSEIVNLILNYLKF